MGGPAWGATPSRRERSQTTPTARRGSATVQGFPRSFFPYTPTSCLTSYVQKSSCFSRPSRKVQQGQAILSVPLLEARTCQKAADSTTHGTESLLSPYCSLHNLHWFPLSFMHLSQSLIDLDLNSNPFHPEATRASTLPPQGCATGTVPTLTPAPPGT